MGKIEKGTTDYNDREFAEKLESYTLKLHKSKLESNRYYNYATEKEILKLIQLINYCKHIFKSLENPKTKLKPQLAESYKRHRPALIEALDFWEKQEWLKDEIKERKDESDLITFESLKKKAFDCDKEKENFKDIKSKGLKINVLKNQIKDYSFSLSLMEKKKENDNDNQFLSEAFNEYEPIITEVLEYWKTELDKLESESGKIKQLSDLITHPKSPEIVNGIKTQYKNIKGKRLKLLLLALQELDLLPKERTAKKFHNLCESEFTWKIASYNAMNGYEYNEGVDFNEFVNMKQYIKSLINTK